MSADYGKPEKLMVGGLLSLGVALILTCCSILVVARLDSLQNSYNAHRVASERHSNAAREAVDRECSGRVSSAFIDCATQKLEAAQRQIGVDQDLLAQQYMAHWAGWSVLLGFITTFLSLGSFGLLWSSLAATRKSLDAAVESNAIARDVFAAQHRPWIQFQTAPASPLEFNAGVVRMNVAIVAENLGPVPALDVFVEAQAEITSIPQMPPVYASMQNFEMVSRAKADNGGGLGHAQVMFPGAGPPLPRFRIGGAVRSEPASDYFSITVRVAIGYRSPTDRVRRCTSYNYRLRTERARYSDRIKRNLPSDLFESRDMSIPEDELYLDPEGEEYID